MAKQKHVGLLLLALSAAWNACSSDADTAPEVPQRPELHVEFAPETATLSPMAGDGYSERFATFIVTVSGFENKADADSVGLNVHPTRNLPFALEELPSAEGSRTFSVTVQPAGEGKFDEGVASLRLSLSNIPGHYEYFGGVKTIPLAIVNGKTKDRAIPLTQANIYAFNRYANTEDGLKLHYRLLENIVLPPPQEDTSNWTPLGTSKAPFAGNFDGNGHSLSGLVLHKPGSEHQGLFGVIGEGALIENLGLTGLSVKGINAIGGLAGENQGTVKNSHAAGEVEGSGSFIGGLVGSSGNATVRNCMALNSSVVGTNSVGRVAGNGFSGTLLENHAFGGMTGHTWDNLGLEDFDGADIFADKLREGAFPPLFKEAPWVYLPGHLPGLMGGAVEMPAHIQ